MSILCVGSFQCSKADAKEFMHCLEEYKAYALASEKCTRIDIYPTISSSATFCVLEYWSSGAAQLEVTQNFFNESDALYGIKRMSVGEPTQKKYTPCK